MDSFVSLNWVTVYTGHIPLFLFHSYFVKHYQNWTEHVSAPQWINIYSDAILEKDKRISLRWLFVYLRGGDGRYLQIRENTRNTQSIFLSLYICDQKNLMENMFLGRSHRGSWWPLCIFIRDEFSQAATTDSRSSTIFDILGSQSQKWSTNFLLPPSSRPNVTHISKKYTWTT